MPDTVPLAGEAVLEVVSPDGARRYARITQTPFMIGRGAETGILVIDLACAARDLQFLWELM